ncbi:MAG: Ig-like domain-containing protein [Prevotella sp.]|nr:Ig-like domain-containing protein [Prevotella sp.]
MAREKGGPHYVWGICTNLDKDGNGNPCPNCKSKEKIKLSIRDEFVCPECGEPLTKIKGGDGPNWKLIGKIIAAILVLVGLCIGIYFAFFNKSQPVVGEPPKPDTTVVNKEKDDKEKVDETKEIVDIKQLSIKDAKDFTLAPGATKTLTYIAEPKENDEEPEWESSNPSVATVTEDGVVKAVAEGKATITIKASSVSATVNVEVRKVEPKVQSNNVNLGYGIYEGPTKNGKAHGIGGLIRFTRSYSIDLKKASGETVEVFSGDKLVNVKMDNNRIIQGLLKRTDGSQRWIIIG